MNYNSILTLMVIDSKVKEVTPLSETTVVVWVHLFWKAPTLEARKSIENSYASFIFDGPDDVGRRASKSLRQYKWNLTIFFWFSNF